MNTHTRDSARRRTPPCHATPANNRARLWLFRKVNLKVKVSPLDLPFLLLSWMADSARKGREPRFTLSSSNQLIVQTRRAVFGENLLLSSCLIPYRISLHFKGIFLLLDAAALGFAAAVLHLRYAPAPLYESDDVVTTALLPVVTAAVDGLWVAALCVFHLVSHHRSRFSPCWATGSGCYSTFITLSPSSRNQSASYLRLLSSLYCISVSTRCTAYALIAPFNFLISHCLISICGPLPHTILCQIKR